MIRNQSRLCADCSCEIPPPYGSRRLYCDSCGDARTAANGLRCNDYALVRDNSADVLLDVQRRAKYGPVWADPSPSGYGVDAPTAPLRRRAFEPEPEPEPEILTHRCTSCGASVTTAQSLLPRCPSCGAGAT